MNGGPLSDGAMSSDPPTVRECIALLRTGTVGRVGFVVDHQPRVFPVNYVATDEGRVVVRTGQHGLLARLDGCRVAFEIDGFDRATRSGWCVQVTGVARDLTDSDDAVSTHLRTLRVEPWARGEKDRWLAIEPLEISGRRIEATAWPEALQKWFAGVPMS